MRILLNNITAKAADELVFENTNWEIKEHQCWAITGPTGSGKSLLLEVLRQRLPLLKGQICYTLDETRTYLNPGDILCFSTETHRLFMNQYTGYHQARWQSFEGEENPSVSDVLTWQSIERISSFQIMPVEVDEKAYAEKRRFVIELFHLERLLDRKILHLSHGESRKVFIARLLMQSPRLLILDNPLVGLDGASKTLLKEQIEKLIEAGNPQTLFVAPRVEDMPAGITHLLVVENLQVAAQGEKEALLKRADLARLFSPAKAFAEALPASFERMAQGYARVLNEAHDNQAALVEMRNVSVVYGQETALDEINWTVRAGERWSLSGHNGAGKTTLLSLILADNPQGYKNDLFLFGRKRGSGENIWEIKQRIGWVSPELHIFYSADMSCADVVCSGFFHSVGLYRACTPAQRDTALGWMEALQIEHLQERAFTEVSEGQKRLVLLARALVNHPPLLILDEPCQALDDAQRRTFTARLDQLCAAAPLALIYVTHDSNEMPACITHQLELKRGRVVRKAAKTQ